MKIEEWSVYRPHMQAAGCRLQAAYGSLCRSATLRAERQLQSSPRIVCSSDFGHVPVWVIGCLALNSHYSTVQKKLAFLNWLLME